MHKKGGGLCLEDEDWLTGFQNDGNKYCGSYNDYYNNNSDNDSAYASCSDTSYSDNSVLLGGEYTPPNS
ncbi:MAG: hypothetical protein DMENIID0002_05360 [Rickettsia endosymbiont of Sergentomyia squamirostris]|uniref:Uncharacterized protein n=1 Tax=Candidatus Tisiphia endosymbiont of Sergentomyia squamirostris TaxID=3113639 RepID=A0AAT9G7T7_9RICK